MKKFDVDIDVLPSMDRELYGVRASIYNEKTEKFLPHNSGIYIDDVPIDPETGRCCLDYKEAEEFGYKKVDLLSNTSYEVFKDKSELLEAINKEPDWEILKNREKVSKLPHIANHFDIVSDLEPKSVEDLADVLALIRPGKIELLDEYKSNKKKTRLRLYRRPKKGMYFKKSHAISYAMMIVAIMNSEKFNHGIEW